MKILKSLLIIYLIGIHLIIGYFIYNPAFIENNQWRLPFNPHESTLFISQQYKNYYRLDQNLYNVPYVIFGDSHFQFYNHTELKDGAVNFAVAGDTIRNLKSLIHNFSVLNKTEKILFLIGYNDLKKRTPQAFIADYDDFLSKLPKILKIYSFTIPPAQKGNSINNDILSANKLIVDRCEKYKNCNLIDFHSHLTVKQAKYLDAQFDSGDGIHLNKKGYDILTSLIKKYVK